jgi:hypothetical protein
MGPAGGVGVSAMGPGGPQHILMDVPEKEGG